ILLPHRIDRRPVVDVGEIDRHPQHILEPGTGPIEDRLHVLEDLTGLASGAVAADEATLAVERRDAGDEEQIAEAHRIRIMAERLAQRLDPELLALRVRHRSPPSRSR